MMRTLIKNRLEKRKPRLGIGAKKMPTVDTSGRFKTKNKKHNAKITKNFIIEDFRIGIIHISVDWSKGNDTTANDTLYICRQCFEQWLYDAGKLDWCSYNIDWTTSGADCLSAMAVEEYWDNAEYAEKLKDLKTYIIKENLVG